MKFDTGRAIFVLILILGLAECARILGMSPYSITIFNYIVYTIMMVIFCFIVLLVARLVLIRILGWRVKGQEIRESGSRSGNLYQPWKQWFRRNHPVGVCG